MKETYYTNNIIQDKKSHYSGENVKANRKYLKSEYLGNKKLIKVKKGNNKITELRTILQRESPNS